MAVKLNMVFTRGDATKTVSLANPRTDLTGAEVFAVMQKAVDKEIFAPEGGAKLGGIKRAYLRESIVTELPEA